jgi:hypothetical protein
MLGKPIIRGTRLPVDFILNFLAHSETEEQILQEYKGLTDEDISNVCEMVFPWEPEVQPLRLDTLSVLTYERPGGIQNEHITREDGP